MITKSSKLTLLLVHFWTWSSVDEIKTSSTFNVQTATILQSWPHWYGWLENTECQVFFSFADLELFFICWKFRQNGLMVSLLLFVYLRNSCLSNTKTDTYLFFVFPLCILVINDFMIFLKPILIIFLKKRKIYFYKLQKTLWENCPNVSIQVKLRRCQQ